LLLIDLTQPNAMMTVRTAIDTVFGVKNPPADLTLQDLAATSIDALELVMVLEELSGLELPENFVPSADESVGELAGRLTAFWLEECARQSQDEGQN